MARREIKFTADSDCARCKGTGINESREIAPGERVICGGPNAMVTRRQICWCVRSETREETSE
jgi:hypothetical protein